MRRRGRNCRERRECAKRRIAVARVKSICSRDAHRDERHDTSRMLAWLILNPDVQIALPTSHATIFCVEDTHTDTAL